VDKEMDDLLNFAAKNNVSHLTGFKETVRALISPAALKPFIILFTYFGIYQFSGVNPVTFYAVQIFKVRSLQGVCFILYLSMVAVIGCWTSCNGQR
jgi:hypothetical protein